MSVKICYRSGGKAFEQTFPTRAEAEIAAAPIIACGGAVAFITVLDPDDRLTQEARERKARH